MNPVTRTFTVNGFTLRTRTPRRFALITTRATPVTTENGTYIAYATVTKRTDNLQTARTAQRRYGRDFLGNYQVIIDLTTGEAV